MTLMAIKSTADGVRAVLEGLGGPLVVEYDQDPSAQDYPRIFRSRRTHVQNATAKRLPTAVSASER